MAGFARQALLRGPGMAGALGTSVPRVPHVRSLALASSCVDGQASGLLFTHSKEWCSIVDDKSATGGSVVLRLGVSEEGLDEFGEPGRMMGTAPVGEMLSKGDTVLQIDWEGYQRTASDELYHAVWVSHTM